MEEKFVKPRKHFFICINDRTSIPGNTTPSCGPRIKEEDVKKIKVWLGEQGLSRQVYCTKARCLGFCNTDGGVACVYPEGKFVKGIKNFEELKEFVEKELIEF